MNSNIYKYLLEQGFNDEEIDYIDDNNESIWQTNLLNCKSIIENLREFGLSFEIIHDLIMENPIILSLSIEDAIKYLKENKI